MPNIKAAERGLLFSSDIELENLNNNNDDNDDAFRYDDSTLMDLDFGKELCPRYRQSVPAFDGDCSNVCLYGDGCCQLGDALDCECEGLESLGSSCSKTMVNVSCRAVARPSDCGVGYQYQIIDIKTYPETGLLCCPPGNNPCPLDLDSFCMNVEEPPEYCPSWSRSSVTRSDSYSRNALSSRLLSSSKPSTSRSSLRRRGSASNSKSTELSSSQEPSSSSRTRSSYTRSSSNMPSQSRTTNTVTTETQTRSSSSPKSKVSPGTFDELGTFDEQTGTNNDELNENENNVGCSEEDNGSNTSINNPEIEPGIPEDVPYDGYSDLDEGDVPKDTYSAENIKSAVLESLQSQLRSKTTRSGSFSKSSKYSDSTPLNRKSSPGLKSIPKHQPSELDEFVLNKVDYHPMLSYPRLKTQPNKRSSSMAATAGSSSNCDRHQAKMMKFLRSLYCQRQLTDVVIQVGCSCFSAHRVVLSCFSKYFASRLIQKSCCPLKNTIMLENNISANTFSAILDFMYTGEIQIDRGNLAKMFTAADFLEINSLKVRCERLLCCGFKEGNTSSKSVQLEKQWQQVARNFRVITRTDQFLNLSPDCIQKLLCRDDLTIDSEMDVAKAAVRWLNFDRERRKKWTRSVMACIRFKDLWPEELVRLTNTHQSLLADESIKEAIFEANWYHTCQQRENCKLSSSLD